MQDSNFARHLRSNQTDAERLLWRHLRNRELQGFRFRRQVPLGPYIVDFVCFEQRLVVELDGGQHAEQHSYDAARDDWLRSQGFRIIRFWNNQVLGETEGVLGVILESLLA